MKFAFMVHPLARENRAITTHAAKVVRHLSTHIVDFCTCLHETIQEFRAAPDEIDQRIALLDEFTGISSNGARAEGRIYEIPLDAAGIIENPDLALEHLKEAAQMACDWGAKVIGLGSLTGIIGMRGAYLAEHCTAAVTTGNCLTVFAAMQNLRHVCAAAEIDLSQSTVAVIGIPGSIASAAAKLLEPQCGELLLVARNSSGPAEQLAARLGAEMLLDIPQALKRADIVLAATSSGNCIDQRLLRPGCIVVDVGVPTDVLGTAAIRPDALILSGGLTRVPKATPLDAMLLQSQNGMIPSCLGETLVLALAEREECFSLGRDLKLDRIHEIGALALKLGFDFSQVYSFGMPLAPSALAQFRKSNFRRRQAVSAGSQNGEALSKPGPNGKPIAKVTLSAEDALKDMAERAVARHARYVNPVIVGLTAKAEILKTFVRGQGVYLWDAEGRRYLDFVGGFGAMNLGHNHPAVVEAVSAALSQQAPGFVQSAVNPYAAALAERLVTITPPGLEMVFFANSGTEAVEAAIKLARITTHRQGLLYCDRSYHGKSLGSLSVTGNENYQRPFGPLLPGCSAIPYGDLEALVDALETRQFAAFIVEPLQAEGGMWSPPEGYLSAAQRVCRATGTLLIADEVQTGLGRTGALFAVDHEDVTPDVMTLAKSLGGGLAPIGAMLTRRDLWTAAYGTFQTCALHTSTFGGGSLACAAGLAALDVLEREHLVANARERGEQLFAGLRAIQSRCLAIRSVRGRGLLLGVEFNPMAEALVMRSQEHHGGGQNQYFVPNLPELIACLPALYAMQILLKHHGIYTQTARSHPLVLRVQPPLVISEEQASVFLEGMEQACQEIDFSMDLLENIVCKATVGKHQGDDRSSTPSTPSPSVAEMSDLVKEPVH